MIVGTIDSKYHLEQEDSTSIVKIVSSTGSSIPDDEPLFLLRGRDIMAVELLQRYAMLCRGHTCNQKHMDAVVAVQAKFEQFAFEHPELMKRPD